MRRTGKYVAATEILNQVFIAKRPAKDRRPFLCPWNMYYNQQRYDDKISNPKNNTGKYPHAEMFYNYIHSKVRRIVTALLCYT